MDRFPDAAAHEIRQTRSRNDGVAADQFEIYKRCGTRGTQRAFCLNL